MAETIIQVNRARLATAPQSLPFTRQNEQTQTLGSGAVATAPLVALAYSYAVLAIEGNATLAGRKVAVRCGGHSITMALDNNGCGEISLLPFIREAVLEADTLDNPLYCEATSTFQQNTYRGHIDVTLVETGHSPITMRVYYIFGNYAPIWDEVTDLYFDYDASGETWVNVDAASNYDTSGSPTDFEDNWCNINELVESEPTGDFVMPLDVAWYSSNDDIRFATVNYHFRYDCRVDNVVKVRWLDTNGNLNVRKFTVAGRSHGASVGDSWRRPHSAKEIKLWYNRGNDEGADITANEALTIGDDCIPMTHYDWVKTLASSAVVEVMLGGVWTRVNVGDATVECDPRKAVFSATFALVVPTDDVQQF